jgi:hypothetical protein
MQSKVSGDFLFPLQSKAVENKNEVSILHDRSLALERPRVSLERELRQATVSRDSQLEPSCYRISSLIRHAQPLLVALAFVSPKEHFGGLSPIAAILGLYCIK